MREAAFVKQNKDKWLKFESLLKNNSNISPDQLSAFYVEITDHLSYANTFYAGSNTARYLNDLASSAHRMIYKNKKESKNKFLLFYTKEFPLFFYQYQKQLLFSFLVFAIFAIIGAFSAASDANFVRAVLGDAYVNATLNNIENNDPMAVYKQASETDMFLGITINNVRVGLMAFTLGVLGGLGTLVIIMQNAIMLGSFQYFFYDKGLLWESARTIWIHGTIEISVIIIAACAGLVVGKSILFPKTYSRLHSFVTGIKDGLKIIISTVPFFIIAGFLEGFVTRHTEMPDALAILIISLSFILILWYYVILPHRLHKKFVDGK
ncbi:MULTISPECIES: stage II sporulation protein M [unclassified Zunongwangia]|uniref:stage II sporulation protein M n=1 Tax=unclassified Zunongwangia TaxID=2632541 RepID=UPI0022DDA863|nr:MULTISPECIES: stage II sporulation protein M [unclassified Zunongwangia]WBL21030.1 stage II sporulation protein M [Zunongwangia sp. HRR-M8]WBL27096.1 stage II sporulation protein M [Zunongwangia sp. HGR-M22]